MVYRDQPSRPDAHDRAALLVLAFMLGVLAAVVCL
jgi:hypothetical protein